MIPGSFIFLLRQPEEILKLEETKQKYGALYPDLRTCSKGALSYNLMQMTRRFLFIMCVFQPFSNVPGSIQIMQVLFINQLACIYVGNTEPFRLRRQYMIEIFNETTVYFSSICMMLFTDLVPGVEEQNFCGWFMILITLGNHTLCASERQG